MPQREESKLPILMHEREIMENIENFVVTIVCGETGSGKSTQIPRFIYEAQQQCPWKFTGGTVGITQPRRVAAVSLANRVSQELGTKLGEQVGYQIRFDSHNVSAQTKVKFMTDGILMKEIESDFLLHKYACIIIDEAHERSLNSDILISLLTRISHARCELALKERKENQRAVENGASLEFKYHPLRLVIMSATLRVEDFRENRRLFPKSISGPPNCVNVQTR